MPTRTSSTASTCGERRAAGEPRTGGASRLARRAGRDRRRRGRCPAWRPGSRPPTGRADGRRAAAVGAERPARRGPPWTPASAALPRPLREELIDWLRGALPNEGCGLLVVGPRGRGGWRAHPLRGHAQRRRLAVPLPHGPRGAAAGAARDRRRRRGRVGHRPLARGLAAVSVARPTSAWPPTPTPCTCSARSRASRRSCGPGPSSPAPSTRSCSSASGDGARSPERPGRGVHSRSSRSGECTT